MEAKFFQFPNVGFTEQKLSKEVLDKLRTYVKNKKEGVSNVLAGNINSSFLLEDKNNWFFNKVLTPNIFQFEKVYTKKALVPNLLTKNHSYVLNRFWVNFQKKYEFNPVHDHSGIYSFVIWLDIPSDYEKEKNIPFVKGSNSPNANTFQFVYTNSFGRISTYEYHLTPKHEGTMLFFSNKTQHIVYPFYLSNKTRVSISGNISLDSEDVSL